MDLADGRQHGTWKANPRGSLVGGYWPRFSAYVVSNTPLLMIHPAAKARLEPYDPWQADRDAANEEERPYKQLLRLAQRAQGLDARLTMPTRERQKVERWVRHNGLLGILPHETLAYTNAPHWYETPLEEGLARGSKRGVRHLAPYQTELRKTAGEWTTTLHTVGEERPLSTARRGERADPEMVNEQRVRPAEVIRREWPSGDLKVEPLGRRFNTFFPGASSWEVEAHEFTSPATTTFWRAYGEPIGLLLRYGWQLANCISAFQVWPPAEPWQARNAALAMRQLNYAASESSLVGRVREDETLGVEWSSTSLLACFATLILEDLAGGQRAMTCPVCGGIFLSAAHQARFCSSTCRFTYHKRAQRRRASEGEDE